MLNIIFAVVGRDLKLAMRRQADIVSALFFFIVVSLFPLGIGPEPDLLRKLAPACCGLPPARHHAVAAAPVRRRPS
jgi:ABC-type transport system involved in cytochrome c biogenesis permease component